MRLRKLKNGRIKDMDTGLFVNKKLAKSFANGKRIKPLNYKKSTKRSGTNNHSQHAVKRLTIREYRDGSYDFDINAMDDADLLYYANLIEVTVHKCMSKCVHNK